MERPLYRNLNKGRNTDEYQSGIPEDRVNCKTEEQENEKGSLSNKVS